MRCHPVFRITIPLAGLGMLILLTACSGKQMSSTIQDETMVSGPEAEPVEPMAESIPEAAPTMEEEFVSEPESVPEPIEEAYVAEPSPEAGFEEAYVSEEDVTPEPMMEEPVMEEPMMGEPMMEESVMEEPIVEEPMMEEPVIEEAYVSEPEPEAVMEEAYVSEPEMEPAMEETFVTEPEVEAVVEEAFVSEPEPVMTPLALDDAYFDFDRFSIRHDARDTLEANASQLRESDDWTITIEGHCDERGTAAYNLVLGERRAEAAKRYLENLGVPGDRIETVSYGKERPFCYDHSEECWQQNRRAHFVY